MSYFGFERKSTFKRNHAAILYDCELM